MKENKNSNKFVAYCNNSKNKKSANDKGRLKDYKILIIQLLEKLNRNQLAKLYGFIKEYYDLDCL